MVHKIVATPKKNPEKTLINIISCKFILNFFVSFFLQKLNKHVLEILLTIRYDLGFFLGVHFNVTPSPAAIVKINDLESIL